MQTGIAENLGIQFLLMDGEQDDTEEEDAVDEELRRKIDASLANRRFLLVLEGVWNSIDLVATGVPILTNSANKKSKVVVTTLSISHLYYGRDLISYPIKLEINNLTALDFLNLFREEAQELEYQLRFRGFSTDDDAIVECFYYCALGLRWANVYLIDCWKCEGLLVGFAENWKEMGEALLKEFGERNWLLLLSEGDVALRYPIRSKVAESRYWLRNHLGLRGILEDEWSSPVFHRILLRINLGLRAVPKDEWSSLLFDRISYSDNKIKRILDESPDSWELYSLFLSGNEELKQIPQTFFENMPRLRVLDLSYTGLSHLPDSLSYLSTLRLLNLQACPNLDTLPPSLQVLEKLEVLYLRETPLSKIPEQSFINKNHLRHLDLSFTKICSLPSSISNLHSLETLLLGSCKFVMTLPSSLGLKNLTRFLLSGLVLSKIPDTFFDGMEGLQHLNLSSNSLIEFLPESLSKLINLRKLELGGCIELKTVISHLGKLSALEELDLSDCGALIDNMEDDSAWRTIPKLKHLNLSRTKFPCLSFKDHPSLETIRLEGLTNLAELVLSGTKIKEFPYDISKLTSLKRLDLVDTKHIRVVDWTKLEWLPNNLNWTQCCCFDAPSTAQQGDGLWPFIWVRNAKIFQSLEGYSPLWENCFSQFHIRISPCEEEPGKDDEDTLPFKNNQFVYNNIYAKTEIPGRSTNNYSRHLEIIGGKSLLRYATGVLGNADLVSLRKNTTAIHLTDYYYSLKLKECRLEKCNEMDVIFSTDTIFRNNFKCLENIWISDLAKLRVMSEWPDYNNFECLKYIYLECCPKLVKLFDHDCPLPHLETLEIKFCGRLEELFGGKSKGDGPILPALRSICLWELKKLKTICDHDLPKLQELKVKGCPKLMKLPIDVNKAKEANSLPILISGEPRWWDKVTWQNKGIERRTEFQKCTPFVLPRQN